MIGMYVAEKGDNVRYATRERLAFHSDYPFPKILKKGKITIVGSGTATIPHDAGYLPMVLPYYVDDSGNLRMSSFLAPLIVPSIKKTEIILQNDDADDIECYYYIMANEL